MRLKSHRLQTLAVEDPEQTERKRRKNGMTLLFLISHMVSEIVRRIFSENNISVHGTTQKSQLLRSRILLFQGQWCIHHWQRMKMVLRGVQEAIYVKLTPKKTETSPVACYVALRIRWLGWLRIFTKTVCRFYIKCNKQQDIVKLGESVNQTTAVLDISLAQRSSVQHLGEFIHWYGWN